jgi:hypothetical protein
MQKKEESKPKPKLAQPDTATVVEPKRVLNDQNYFSWVRLVSELPLAGMAKTVIMHCNLIEKKDGLVRLGVEENYQAMLTSTAKASIEKALKQYWQQELKVLFEIMVGVREETPAMVKTRVHDESLQQAKNELSNDACFNDIVSRFDAQVDMTTAKLTE